MKEIDKENENNCFFDVIVNYGLVIRGNLEVITQIKTIIKRNPSIEVIYQKYSFNRLYIKEGGDIDDAQ